ncbi:MAG: transposase [bacterium]|nr:transposase [bacterium]
MHIGPFRTKEFILQCPHDQIIFTSKSLRGLVPEQGKFGYDVIVFVGLAMFVKGRNNKEIQSALAKANIIISERGISFLGRKFVIYLALAHRESQDRLQKSMMKNGGYVLHLDGTCEGDSPHLFCGLDGITELILDNIKLPSEKKELLIPFFRRIKEQYGQPAALVHDMGAGIQGAIREVFPGTPDFICHFHFLRDIGKDLLLDDYQIIKRCLTLHKIRTSLKQKARYYADKLPKNSLAMTELKAGLKDGDIKSQDPKLLTAAAYLLIEWAFEAPSQSKGYGFPFDRPHFDFLNRLHEIHDRLGKIINLRGKAKGTRPLMTVYHLLEKVITDDRLVRARANLETKIEVFDRLRAAMRIAPFDGHDGLKDDGGDADLKTIETEVTKFRQWLISDDSRKKTYSKMIEQIDKYWEKLFAAPLVLDTATGQTMIYPQRTNNILERFFRGEKRLGRKRTGTKSLNKMLKAILSDTPLIRNLENAEYFQIILNGCSSLEERFSLIEAKQVREKLKEEKCSQERIAPDIKRIIKQPDLPEKILTLLAA